MNKLYTINAEELQNRTYEPTHFLMDKLIPEGLHILAGTCAAQREMASIRKRGGSYLLVVSMGCTPDGRRSNPQQKTVKPSTTLDIYTHAFDKNKKAASQIMQSSLEI